VIEGRPSRTAERVAIRRAAHQLFDRPIVFEDPIALGIVGAEAAARIDRAVEDEPSGLGLRALVVARSRYAEDALARAVVGGTRQYVVLGAGLDTFAYRNPYSTGRLRIFEVDHPATQAWKRAQLEAAGIAVPADLVFAPVDFERDTLAHGLRAAGWDAGTRTFFSWLGVVPYLELDAIRTTLGVVASAAPGSEVVFDYSLGPASLPPAERRAFEALAARVAAAGEPWRTFFEPAALAEELTVLGLAVVEDLPADALNARYFAERKDGLRLRGRGHLMHACVASR
jgi:methyltransferase (TIGR00027 family)